MIQIYELENKKKLLEIMEVKNFEDKVFIFCLKKNNNLNNLNKIKKNEFDENCENEIEVWDDYIEYEKNQKNDETLAFIYEKALFNQVFFFFLINKLKFIK